MPVSSLVEPETHTVRSLVSSTIPRAFDLESISRLSNEDIRSSMSKDQLIQIIRSVDYPFAGKERLEFFDRDTLERVVCLVRRWSCRQLGKPTL